MFRRTVNRLNVSEKFLSKFRENLVRYKGYDQTIMSRLIFALKNSFSYSRQGEALEALYRDWLYYQEAGHGFTDRSGFAMMHIVKLVLFFEGAGMDFCEVMKDDPYVRDASAIKELVLNSRELVRDLRREAETGLLSRDLSNIYQHTNDVGKNIDDLMSARDELFKK